MKFNGQEVEVISSDVWSTHISKPIFGTRVSLNSKLIHAAIDQGVKLRVTCPGGEELVDPLIWKDTAVKRAQYFKYNTPIWLYERDITPVSRVERNTQAKLLVLEEHGQEKLF